MRHTEQGGRSRLDKLVERTRPAEDCPRKPVLSLKFGRRPSERPAIDPVRTDEDRLWAALLAGQ